jgi:hypothetical protein
MEMIILTISIVALAITSIIALSIVIYNQMLMVNEVNKRLLLLAKESQEKERLTMAELESWIRSSGSPEAPLPKTPEQTNEEPFDPYKYSEEVQQNENDL